jgi:hypothetical protein
MRKRFELDWLQRLQETLVNQILIITYFCTQSFGYCTQTRNSLYTLCNIIIIINYYLYLQRNYLLYSFSIM